MTGISHHGSHAFWRNTPWVGSSGAAGAAGPPRPGSLTPPLASWDALSWPIWGPWTCGARNCGIRTLMPPGPSLTSGGYSCGLYTRGP